MSKQKRMTSFGGQPPSAADRKHERIPVRRLVTVTLLDQNHQPTIQWSGGLQDLSAGGASVILADMPTEGDKVIVAIAPTADNRGACFYAKVVHVGLVDGEWIRVGMRFLKAPAAAQPVLDAIHEDLISRSGLTTRHHPSDAAVDAALDHLGRPHRQAS